MSAISDTYENGILDLMFRGTAIADIAENDTTSPLANLFLALHTADPTDTGDQTTSEIAYTSYARVSIDRTGSGFDAASGGSTALTAAMDFPTSTGGAGTATYFSVGTLTSGAGIIMWYGALDTSIVVVSGLTPRLGTGTVLTLA